MNEKKVLFVGLPETGKTTFLAALWHLVDSEVKEKAFKLISLKGDQEYLNSIREAWLSYETVPRTYLREGLSKEAEMILEQHDTSERVTLVIPDLSGELFKVSLENRQWSEDFNNLVVSTPGIVLFINPSKLLKPMLVTDAQDLVGILEEDEQDQNEEATDDKIEEADNQSIPPQLWEPDLIPTQVKLVDLLQLLINQRSTLERKLKLSIVISAWDIIENRSIPESVIEPIKWLEYSLPLLYQFLVCNLNIIDLKAFGVSAQGAEYKTGKFEKLFNFREPAERIIVKVDSEYSNDISLPISWVTSQ